MGNFLDSLKKTAYSQLESQVYAAKYQKRMDKNMVTFKLIEETETTLIYWYFPNGDETAGHGIIIIEKQKNEIKIEKLAENDFSRVVTVEEQNAIRNSINTIRAENHFPPLTEEEWPSATCEFISTFFADHAVHEISTSYNRGEVLPKGTVSWY